MSCSDLVSSGKIVVGWSAGALADAASGAVSCIVADEEGVAPVVVDEDGNGEDVAAAAAAAVVEGVEGFEGGVRPATTMHAKWCWSSSGGKAFIVEKALPSRWQPTKFIANSVSLDIE